MIGHLREQRPETPAVPEDTIMIAHGGGGELTAQLIRSHIFPPLANDLLASLDDSAIVPWSAGEVVFTTDSYVVTPLEFPGGDIGRIAVAGTVNDISVMGAKPVALSLGLVLEEGLSVRLLDKIIGSIAETAKSAGVPIVTGDTKVIDRRGQSDGIVINTAGIGRLLPGPRLSTGRIQPGDAILVSGTIADHGMTIMSLRAGVEFKSKLCSDAAPLNHMVEGLLNCGADIRFMRDATRGGLSGVLADVVESTGLSLEVSESRIPIREVTLRAAEMLGLDPLAVANEGKLVCIVAAEDADKALQSIRSSPEGHQAEVIGRVTREKPSLAELITRSGGRRIIQRSYGEELPRIC